MRLCLIIICFLTINLTARAQKTDTLNDYRFSIHQQVTVINQSKFSFNPKYTGDNSLLPKKESRTSVTSTLFLGAKLWKGATIFINPEIAGGSGLSQVLGIAAAPNGETFRIGSPEPKIYLARLFYKQVFSLSKEKIYRSGDFNQLKDFMPERFFAVTIGKISIADFFDNNKYSHDPRTQFMSWALMDNGAWDYPANTRGYTPSIVLEYITQQHELRYGVSMVPLVANGPNMNKDISKASSHTLEYTHRHKINNKEGAIRFLGFFTTTDMGNYRQSIELNPDNPVIANTRKYGNTKFGFGINAEQDLNQYLGCFFRASWNDGRNETWAFTEIDRSISGGISMTAEKLKRKNDNIGLAFVSSGLSKPHRDYLKAGGKGFMLGDGNLNYAWESLAEFYYSAAVIENIVLTATYQFLLNPGYNQDRKGPVNIYSIRIHSRI